jgi:hypothetical protein
MRWTEAFSAALAARLLQAYRKPLGFLLSLVLLPLAFVATVTYRFSVQLQEQQALQHLSVTARLAAEIVEETLQQTIQLEQLLSRRPEFRAALLAANEAALAEQLGQALTLAPRLSALTVLDAEGNVVADVVGQQLGRAAQAPGQTPDQAVIPEWLRLDGLAHVSPVHFQETPQPRKVVSIYCPILAQGRVIGLLQAEHEVEEIKAWLQKIRVEPHGFLYVVDQAQQLVVYPYQVLPGRPKVVADWPTVRAPLTETGAALRFEDARSKQAWLAGLSPVAHRGWRVVAVQPRAAVLQILNRSLRAMGLLLAILAVVLVVVSLWWARLQASSLQLLRQNTKLLKEMQQRMLLDRRKRPPEPPEAGGGP